MTKVRYRYYVDGLVVAVFDNDIGVVLRSGKWESVIVGEDIKMDAVSGTFVHILKEDAIKLLGD